MNDPSDAGDVMDALGVIHPEGNTVSEYSDEQLPARRPTATFLFLRINPMARLALTSKELVCNR